MPSRRRHRHRRRGLCGGPKSLVRFTVLPRTRHLLRPDSVALAKMFEKTERVRVLGHIRPPAMTFGRICPCASFKPSSGHLRWGLSNPFEMVSPESPPLNFSRGPLGRVSSRL